MKFTTMADVWAAIDAGRTVHWSSDAYAITVEPSNLEWRARAGFGAPESDREGQCLRVTCTANWFGSLLQASELARLYVKEDGCPACDGPVETDGVCWPCFEANGFGGGGHE